MEKGFSKGWVQNLLENWVSKQSFFVLILTTAWIFFLGIKLFVFQDRKLTFSASFGKRHSWKLTNFQLIHLIQTIFTSMVVWLISNFVRFLEILFQADAESFSFLSWKTKSFIPKKNDISQVSEYARIVLWPTNKWLYGVLIFREGFGHAYQRVQYQSNLRDHKSSILTTE